MFILQRKLLDVSLGFAAGVMVAASYWSLLAPAIEMAAASKYYGPDGEYAFVPVGIGFLFGAAFVYGTDQLISILGIQSPNVLLAMQSVGTKNNRKIIGKVKSDGDLDDSEIVSEVEITGGKYYPHVGSTTIDGISHKTFTFIIILLFACYSVFFLYVIITLYICIHTRIYYGIFFLVYIVYFFLAIMIRVMVLGKRYIVCLWKLSCCCCCFNLLRE